MYRTICMTIILSMFASIASAIATNNAVSGEIRVLDKITGRVHDVTIPAGQSKAVGLLTINLHECRYPAGNTGRDAFGSLSLYYGDPSEKVFAGWMIASAPALNALDHPRYDVWMIRCVNE